MADYEGLPYPKVLQRVIARELVNKGPRTLEKISEDTVLNGKHPSLKDLKEQADSLIDEGKIIETAVKGEYKINKRVLYF